MLRGAPQFLHFISEPMPDNVLPRLFYDRINEGRIKLSNTERRELAGLGALKRTMGFTIILVFAIFLGLLTVISAFFLDPITGLAFGLVGAFFIIILQYLIGPVIVRLTSRLH